MKLNQLGGFFFPFFILFFFGYFVLGLVEHFDVVFPSLQSK